MNFKDWLLSQGLSTSTAKKYESAINGVLSEWAITGGILQSPLASVSNCVDMGALIEKFYTLPIFIERNKRGHKMYSNALIKYAEYLSKEPINNIESDIEYIAKNYSLSETEKSALVKARIGQGIFRQKLISYWGGCSVTAFKDFNLLLASHIKPWRASSHAERLDVHNGLLLLPNLDKAFDAGLITFSIEGKIRISPQLVQPEQLGIHKNLTIKLAPEHIPYIEFHQTKIFRIT